MKYAVSGLVAIVFFFIFPTSVRAEVIHTFDTQIQAATDGRFSVVEKINYDFEDEERHGIFRYIPTVSKVGDLYRVIEIAVNDVKRDGQKEQFEKSSNNDQVYLKIG